MVTYKHRELSSAQFLGERVDFIASNDRIRERVENLSHERYVLEKLSEVTSPDSVFWDVGSCLGIHAFIMAKQLPDGQVISFEPMPSNRSVSIDNKAVNQIENIHILEKALSNEDGEAVFDIRESTEPGYGRHGLAIGEGYDSVQSITVPTRTGDSMTDYQTPDVVKIDVEGAGPLVLEGMEATLSDPDCRHIIFETHEPNPVQPSHEDVGYTVEDIISLMESYGFTVQEMEESFHLYGRKELPEGGEFMADSDVDVSFVQGDIAEIGGDVAISSVGTSMYLGTGVAGALSQAAGPMLQEEALSYSPVDVGSAVVTDAYDLPYSHIVHAASMPHHGTGESTPSSIFKSTRNALQEADALGVTSVVCPAVGCGLGGVPLSIGLEKIIQAVWSVDFESVSTVELCLYSEDEYNTATQIFG